MTTSNIEAAARSAAMAICRRHPRPGEDERAWIDRHWEAVAAELEAGLIDEEGAPLPGYTVERAQAALYDWCARRFASIHGP